MDEDKQRRLYWRKNAAIARYLARFCTAFAARTAAAIFALVVLQGAAAAAGDFAGKTTIQVVGVVGWYSVIFALSWAGGLFLGGLALEQAAVVMDDAAAADADARAIRQANWARNITIIGMVVGFVVLYVTACDFLTTRL